MPTLKQLVPLLSRLGGDADRLLQAVNPTVAKMQADVLRFAEQLDPDRCDARMLPHLLRMLGWNIALTLPERQTRGLVKAVTTIYRQKGTRTGMVNALRLVLGIDVNVLVFAVADDQWALGVSVLGVSTILGATPGGGAADAFQVVVPRLLTADEKAAANQIITLMKPHHTQYLLIEPSFVSGDGFTLAEVAVAAPLTFKTAADATGTLAEASGRVGVLASDQTQNITETATPVPTITPRLDSGSLGEVSGVVKT